MTRHGGSFAFSLLLVAGVLPSRAVAEAGKTFQAVGLEWQAPPAVPLMAWPAADAYCRSLALTGGGWRLPTREELLSLYGAKTSSLELRALDGMTGLWLGSLSFWSSSPAVNNADHWQVYFDDGSSHQDTHYSAGIVRCVRGQSAAKNPDTGAGTFQAAAHEWQETPPKDDMTWEQAKGYCAHLPLAGGGWHLPTKDELLALYAAKASSVAVAAHPGMTSDGWFWTSSPHPRYRTDGWAINFGTGGENNYGGSQTIPAVRCVR
jgi:formylglycine-generating enzyme required for sulfatase activity